MKKVYVIQMHTGTIFSKIVKFVTRYNYSHIAISFNKNCDYIYNFGRKDPDSILNAGFVMENKTGKFFQKFKNTKCRIFEVEITDNQYNELVRIIKHMKKNEEIYKYDYLGVFLRFLGIPISFRNRYVCSYFVAQLLEEADVCNFDKETFFVNPRDFENINGFNLIYTGSYSSYK